MTDITIPDEALEAHAKALLTHETWGLRSWSDLSDAEREERLEGSEVACLAMIRAWPGMRMMVDIDTGDDAAIKLPLLQEASDE